MWLQSDENFIRFDEKLNTYDSLEKLFLFLNNIEKDLNFWKWVIIALHSALYGAMILTLQGTNSDRVCKLPIEKKKINTIDDNGKHITIKIPNKKLISFITAFKRIQQLEFIKMNINSHIFEPQHHHYEAIEWINDELRNPFLHFIPKTWSIGIKGLKDIFRNCLEIIEFCLFKSNNVFFDGDEKEKFENILKKIRNHKNLSSNKV